MEHKGRVQLLNIYVVNFYAYNVINLYNGFFIFRLLVPTVKDFMSLFGFFIVVRADINQ